MEWLRWIVLLVGLLVIGGIVWMYRRHRSEQAVDLGGGRADPGGYHDPIDASVGARDDEADAGEARREPQLELGGSGYWSEPDEDGFIDGASKARVVSPADDAEPAPRGSDDEASSEPVIGPDEDQAAPEPAPEERPRPGFSRLFTRQGQQPQEPQPSTEPQAENEAAPSADTAADEGSEDAEASVGGAVISMMIVDREQSPMPAERVRRAVEEAGFEYGEFSIYHFHGLDGEEWFSLMNAVSPGHFDPDDLTSYETPALALFMQLPVRGSADASLVFDRMHQVASSLAESLDAMLIDDRREPLDSESIDRYRELIEQHG
ncbi:MULTISPECIES: cell division protein ZipA C-terminal FtsZ-binding domain-containing protein [unclassified Guyparkeria]|uniref:cell division protein ZipA C-terminal FtsZ-binding domain-containing protein n=1 Tax=unclassified Guyparkeria TaxID=2626246 RepID=UPI00073378BF|nr:MULTISPECIES: cell division protein ZipA C-terminal FtsZ-binding domain-containing protein [unclassified Guyparkeria]KTG16794.1 hypothetical protein AUR63_01635 [Guyparkeria sp. XI15]OAE85828.1 hypothetical protein AWR35_01635 [Guyparkeria sp. WRN-7]